MTIPSNSFTLHCGTSSQRSLVQRIFFIGPAGHIDIMIDCLQVMFIPPEDRLFFVGESQKYACNNWCAHFHQALLRGGYNLVGSLRCGSLLACLNFFLSHSSDMWLNTLILELKEHHVSNNMRFTLQTAGCMFFGSIY